METKHIKCVVVGDAGVPKTQLLYCYVKGPSTDDYVPAVFDNLAKKVEINGQLFALELWDAYDQGELDNLRILSYEKTDVFIFCFSLVNPKSLENIENKWIKEVRENRPDTPIILAGLEVDLRDEFENKPDECKSRKIEPVSSAKGKEMARKINALAYIECSETKGTNVNALFNIAILSLIGPPKFMYIYVIGKNTQNKVKLSQILDQKVIEGSCMRIIISITEEEVDGIKKEEEASANSFYYVYNVDDRETFEKYEGIHKKLKRKFSEDNNEFVLYGINVNIEGERSVSYEELITTAFNNKIFYFELQEFNMEKILEQTNDHNLSNETIYFTGLEESGYNKFYNKCIKEMFSNYEIHQELFIPKRIEEMEPLEDILGKAIEEKKKIVLYFIYSPFNRRTFTTIEEYVSKCTNLQNFYKLPIYLQKFEENDGEEREHVTSLETKIFCQKKRIELLKSSDFNNHFKFESSKVEIRIQNKVNKASIKLQAKETIHIFCNTELEEKLIDNKIIEFVNEEECIIIRYNDQIFKYKVEFHNNEEYAFTEEMKYILCFVKNDDESRLEYIQESKIKMETVEFNFHIIIENTMKFDKDEEQNLIKSLRSKYVALSNNYIPFPKIENEKEACEYNDLFTRLIIEYENADKVDEKTCCRI